ncbi:MAG TPA: site-specific integrase [Tepidisphaeraceae bacterium]|jgi:integrase|nr:site-specific integrase [Tepidisphaeraceae bacterium]
MPRPKSDTPGYCLHKQSGRAYTTIAGKQHLFAGPHGSPESRAAYDRLIGEWLTSGRTLVNQTPHGPTVSMVAAAFCSHADAHYVHPDGTPTGEAHNFKLAMRPLRRLYGATPAASFGPKSLKVVRKDMLTPKEDSPGWSRTYTNRQIDRLKMIFRWAAAEEMIPASVYHALATVDAIRIGKESARETEPVGPVAVETVEATLLHLPPAVAALVRLQLLTGARGGELFILRTCDIDRSAEVWKYQPRAHKTAHHGHARTIYFGPQAQEVLTPFLKLDLQAYLFAPADSAEWRLAQQRRRQPSERSGSRKYPFHPHYLRHTYGRAIARAAEQANRWGRGGRICADDAIIVPHWHPHQLRHTAGTMYRRDGDFEAAKIILGHKTDSMTQHYAERDSRKAEELVARIG